MSNSQHNPATSDRSASAPLNDAPFFSRAEVLARRGMEAFRDGSRLAVGGIDDASAAVRAQVRARPAAATLLMAAAVMALVALASLIGSPKRRP